MRITTTRPVKYPEYAFIVNATVQKRGRPASSFEEAKRFFSGKHWISCFKSQVATNRREMAMHITANIPESVHDLALFKDTHDQRTKLVRPKGHELTKIHADKGCIGFREDILSQFVTPHKKPVH
jgi:hypothetical protein